MKSKAQVMEQSQLLACCFSCTKKSEVKVHSSYFQTSYLKCQLCSHVIKNDFTKCDFTKYSKIRHKFQNNLLPPVINFRRISAMTKDRNRLSPQKALKWKNMFLFQTYYFVLSYMSFIVILIPELHP